jgi:hypothetical protein
MPFYRTVLRILAIAMLQPVLALGAVEAVHSPDTPVHPPETIQAEELWRIDEESEDVVIGVIGRIVVGKENRIHIFDQQQDDVIILDRNGELIDRIGCTGEGPGQYQKPVDMILTDEGEIGIVQTFTRSVVLLSPDGESRGVIPLPPFWDDGRPLVRQGAYAAGRLLLWIGKRNRMDPAVTVALEAMIGVAPGDSTVVWHRERRRTRPSNMNDYKEIERSYYTNPWEWSVDPEGTLFVSEAYDRYEILVFTPEGDLSRTISREFETRTRDRNYVKNLQIACDEVAKGKTYRGYPNTYEVSKFDMDIQELFAREDGWLWVLSSRGAFDTAEGEIATFDLFDAAGRFGRQVTVLGEGDYYTDSFFISGEFLFVVRNAGEDRRKPAGEAEDGYYELICYRLPLAG